MNIKTTQFNAGRSLLARQAIFMLFLLSAFSVSSQTYKNVIHFGGMDPVANTGNNNVHAIGKDDSGNIYVTGEIDGTADLDPAHPGVYTISDTNGNIFLAKYDSADKFIWGKSIASTFGNCNDIGVDAAGNIYIAGSGGSTGYFRKSSSGTLFDTIQAGLFFAKYDNNGNYQWVKTILATQPGGRLRTNYGIACGMAVSRQGDIYITCTDNRGTDTIDFDPGPNKYLVFGTSAYQGRIALAKYNTAGNLVWANVAKGMGRATSAGFLSGDNYIEVDTSGYLYLGGSRGGDTLDFDFGPNTTTVPLSNGGYLVKYDTSGKYIWANGVPVSAGIAVDGWGNIYTAGWLQGPYDFDPGAGTTVLTQIGATDLYIAKYNSSGSYLWAKNVGSTGASVLGTNIISTNAIGLGANGNLYVTGYFTGDANFNPNDNTATKLTASFMDMFLAQYDACGNLGSVGAMGAVAPDIAVINGNVRGSLVTTSAGYIYVGGSFAGIVDFDPGAGTALINPVVPMTTGSDAFIAKYYSGKDKVAPVKVNVTTCDNSYTLNGKVYTTAGTYTQVMPTAQGCADSTVEITLTFSTIVKPLITINSFVLGVAGTYNSYQWFKDGTAITGETNATYTVTSNGQYRVVVTNSTNCTDTSDVYTITNVSVANVAAATQIKIYPNPASKVVYVKSPISVSLQITDISGRVVKEAMNSTSMSVGDLAQGIYLLKVSDKNGALLKVEKLVKE